MGMTQIRFRLEGVACAEEYLKENRIIPLRKVANRVYETPHSIETANRLAALSHNGLIGVLRVDVPDEFEIFEEVTDYGDVRFLRGFENNSGDATEYKIEMLIPNTYRCARCGHEMRMGVQMVLGGKEKYPEPFQCENETCGRKGPFKRITPIPTGLWLLPPPPIECKPIELFRELRDYYSEHVVMPTEFFEIDAALTMASWTWEQHNSFPYRFFLGKKSTGKTQALDVQRHVCYHGVKSSTITPEAIYRFIEKCRPSLFIDEAELQLNMNFERGRMLFGVLNSGYKRGDKAIRCNSEKDTIDGFDVFGYKALAATHSFAGTFEDRCIITTMTEDRPTQKKIDTEWADRLRGELLYFRMYCSKNIYPIEGVTPDGRLNELLAPVMSVFRLLDRDTADVVRFALENRAAMRREEDVSSDDADAVRAVKNIIEEGVAQQELTGDAGKVWISDILKRMNDSDRSEKEKVGNRELGWIFRRLNIPRYRVHGGARYILINEFLSATKSLSVTDSN